MEPVSVAALGETVLANNSLTRLAPLSQGKGDAMTVPTGGLCGLTLHL